MNICSPVLLVSTQTPLDLWVIHGLTGAIFRIIGINAVPFVWTERRAPEPDQMAGFGELSGAHCLRGAQFIDFDGASSFGNRGDQIGEVFHGFLLSLDRI